MLELRKVWWGGRKWQIMAEGTEWLSWNYLSTLESSQSKVWTGHCAQSWRPLEFVYQICSGFLAVPDSEKTHAIINNSDLNLEFFVWTKTVCHQSLIYVQVINEGSELKVGPQHAIFWRSDLWIPLRFRSGGVCQRSISALPVQCIIAKGVVKQGAIECYDKYLAWKTVLSLARLGRKSLAVK